MGSQRTERRWTLKKTVKDLSLLKRTRERETLFVMQTHYP